MTLRKLIKTITTIVFITVLIKINLFAQNRTKTSQQDTIVIYETIVVYDTLHVYDTLNVSKERKASTIPFLSLKIHHFSRTDGLRINNEKKIENLLKKSATIQRTGIIHINTNKIDTQKVSENNKAQQKIKASIYLGSGSWWLNISGKNTTSCHFATTITGLSLDYPIGVFTISSGISYSSLIRDFNFSDDLTESWWEIEGAKDSIFDFNQISIPLKFGYRLSKIEPFVGLEYSFCKLNHSGTKINSLNLHFSVLYHFVKRAAVAIHYSLALSGLYKAKKYEQADFFSSQIVEKIKGTGQSREFELCFYFFLKK